MNKHLLKLTILVVSGCFLAPQTAVPQALSFYAIQNFNPAMGFPAGFSSGLKMREYNRVRTELARAMLQEDVLRDFRPRNDLSQDVNNARYFNTNA